MSKKEVYKVGELTEGKQELIRRLVEKYDIKSAADLHEALKELLGGILKSMPIRNWGTVYGELSVMFEGRLPE